MSDSKKYYFSFSERGYLIIKFIPIVFLLVLGIIKLYYGLVFILLVFIFIVFTLYLRKLIYFDKNKFCTFYLFEGVRTHKYQTIEEIYLMDKKNGSFDTILWIEYEYNGKIRKAMFELKSYDYMAEVLTFLNTKVETSKIDVEDFTQRFFTFENGVFKYDINLPYKRKYGNSKKG
jgi:c-di-AMP phosphodiesterase-like protein